MSHLRLAFFILPPRRRIIVFTTYNFTLGSASFLKIMIKVITIVFIYTVKTCVVLLKKPYSFYHMLSTTVKGRSLHNISLQFLNIVKSRLDRESVLNVKKRIYIFSMNDLYICRFISNPRRSPVHVKTYKQHCEMC